jgi:ribosomal-protein-alanine N-acetyltransferase
MESFKQVFGGSNFPKPLLSLNTQRLQIRDITETDWQQISEYSGDPDVYRYMLFGPHTLEQTKDFVKRAITHQSDEPRLDYIFAKIEYHSGKIVGNCWIHVTSVNNREGRIGYSLNKAYWKNGYGTETAKALIEFGFAKLRLHRIYATCDPANVGSKRILEKIGMKYEGHLKEHKWTKGRWRDSLLYAILESDSCLS